MKLFCKGIGLLLLSNIFLNVVIAEDNKNLLESSPISMKGAELFGLVLNDLSQETLEDKLAEMGVTNFPNASQKTVDYSLGDHDVLGIRGLSVYYNDYYFVEKIILAGSVESPKLRKKLGNLLVKRYKDPMAGSVNNGYGRAQWRFNDGTMIELNNTTFDVSVVYRDLIPSRELVAGEIDVQALKDRL